MVSHGHHHKHHANDHRSAHGGVVVMESGVTPLLAATLAITTLLSLSAFAMSVFIVYRIVTRERRELEVAQLKAFACFDAYLQTCVPRMLPAKMTKVYRQDGAKVYATLPPLTPVTPAASGTVRQSSSSQPAPPDQSPAALGSAPLPSSTPAPSAPPPSTNTAETAPGKPSAPSTNAPTSNNVQSIPAAPLGNVPVSVTVK